MLIGARRLERNGSEEQAAIQVLSRKQEAYFHPQQPRAEAYSSYSRPFREMAILQLGDITDW
jgi:hypothetical protein